MAIINISETALRVLRNFIDTELKKYNNFIDLEKENIDLLTAEKKKIMSDHHQELSRSRGKGQASSSSLNRSREVAKKAASLDLDVLIKYAELKFNLAYVDRLEDIKFIVDHFTEEEIEVVDLVKKENIEFDQLCFKFMQKVKNQSLGELKNIILINNSKIKFNKDGYTNPGSKYFLSEDMIAELKKQNEKYEYLYRKISGVKVQNGDLNSDNFSIVTLSQKESYKIMQYVYFVDEKISDDEIINNINMVDGSSNKTDDKNEASITTDLEMIEKLYPEMFSDDFNVNSNDKKI